MRNTLVVMLMAIVGPFAMAEQNFGMAGCGWGSQVMGPDGSQVLAATTNGTGSQGFALSSGTSNCVSPSKMAALRAQQEFFASNLKILSKEMAQGEGEYVKALAQTMGCKGEVHNEFARQMQQSYTEIFSAPGAMSMLSKVRKSIHSNQNLNSNCDTII
ncbi:MAG: DUF3015 family protein [Bdellovibrionales bacterium]